MHPSLGYTGKDKITGFTGVITGFVEYLTGCNQLLISPGLDEKGAPREAQWFDDSRIDLTKAKPIVLNESPARGPDKAAPKR